MNAKNIDLVDVECFGYSMPKKDSWLEMLSTANTCKDVQNLGKFKDNFKWNVETCYYRMCGIIAKDLDTDFEYFISFINGKKKWDVEIAASKNAEVLPEEKADLFKNELVAKAIDKAFSYITQAKAAYEQKVKTEFDNGSFTEVDELKLESILKWTDDKTFMDNFKNKVTL